MREELRLPDELAACEARLAALALPAAAINRDELLFRAGWAAHDAASPTSAVGRAGWTSHALAAAVAAVVATIITLRMAPSEQAPGGATPLAENTAEKAAARGVGAARERDLVADEGWSGRIRPIVVRRGIDVDAMLARFDDGRLAAGSSVFGLQMRETDRVATNMGDDVVAPSRKPLTSRQFLDVKPFGKKDQSPSAWRQAPALEGDAI